MPDTGSGALPPTRATLDSDVSAFELLTPLVRRSRLILATALACAVVAALVLFLQRPVYTGEATFTPETASSTTASSGLAGLVGLAGQLGLGLGSSSSVSPEFFVELLDSREILRATLLTDFDDSQRSGVRRPLLDVLDVRAKTQEARLQKGTRVLSKRIDASVDKPTGVVTLEVEMNSPGLSAAVANRMIGLLNEFNLERRQSQSREQSRFTGTRLEVAQQELRDAERAQLAFLERNRVYRESPLLTFEASRLARNVQVKQEVFLTLTKAHEEARISEVRDTPVLTLIDSAVAPVQRTRPRRTLGILLGLAAGAALGVGLAYAAAMRDRVKRAQGADYRELQAAWRDARGRPAPSRRGEAE